MKRLVLAAGLALVAGAALATAPQNIPGLSDWENWLIQTLVYSQGPPLATGATPTPSGACGAGLTTATGGSAAGSFKAGSPCSATAIVFTFLAAAPNGYRCGGRDITTTANTLVQSAYTTTTCTLTATLSANDVFVFDVQGF